jgi:hypothetical protein
MKSYYQFYFKIVITGATPNSHLRDPLYHNFLNISFPLDLSTVLIIVSVVSQGSVCKNHDTCASAASPIDFVPVDETVRVAQNLLNGLNFSLIDF